jgi:hypothetical protein
VSSPPPPKRLTVLTEKDGRMDMRETSVCCALPGAQVRNVSDTETRLVGKATCQGTVHGRAGRESGLLTLINVFITTNMPYDRLASIPFVSESHFPGAEPSPPDVVCFHG